jgi:hypothetical protein
MSCLCRDVDIMLSAIVHVSDYPRSNTIRLRHYCTIILKLFISCIFVMNVFNLLYQPNVQQFNTYPRRFRYKHSIFREHKTSGLKQIANDKL